MHSNGKSEDIGLSRRYSQSDEMIECFLSIDIDSNINEGSISKKYKWITSLQLISADEFRQKIFVKQRNYKQEEMVKHFPIDKLLYLAVNFCEQGKFPIARIRTRKQRGDSEWITVPYPKEFQGLYEHNICYQYKQSKQCKRIISDIEICHEKELEDVSNADDQWEIATIPEINCRLSKNERLTQSESEESGQSRVNSFNLAGLESKLSDRSDVRENNSNLSQNSYYSCNQNQSHSKSSTDKDHFSDLDEVSPSHHSISMQSKKSSLSEFHSIQETGGPFYFLMKTIDLYDNHNQFQYRYEPKITKIQKVSTLSGIDEKYLRSITKFCFPNGIRLFKKISGCGFQTFTLILTTDQGQRYFAYCLKYKQRMSPQVEKHLLRQLYELHLIDKDQIYKNQTIINEKVFCLVSKIQNTDAFHKILENLYRALLSFSSPQRGSEYFSHLKGPKDERKLQFFAQDLVGKLKLFSRNLFKKERRNPIEPIRQIPMLPDRNQKLQFKWCGVNTYFPKKEPENKVSMKALYCLFKLLSVDNIVKILEAALLEKKIFIVSSIQTSILLVIEALIGLLYPLRLSQPIVPIISQELLDLIEAPIPLVAGIGEEFVNENTMTKAIYAFLDCNKILALQELPSFCVPLNKLWKELKKIQLYSPDHVIELLNFKQEAYSFGIHQIQEYNSETHQQIKVLFENCVVSIIKNYASCYSKNAEENMKISKSYYEKKSGNTKEVQSERLSKTSSSSQKYTKHMTFREMYGTGKFMKLHQKKQQPFYEEFCKSSIFKNLIQQKYSNPESDEIKVIDQAIEHIQEDVIHHLSCLNIPVSSLRRQSFGIHFNYDQVDYKKQTAVKAKTKLIERQMDERGSLTSIKDQQMKKNLSYKEQEKLPRNNLIKQRKAANIPTPRDNKLKQIEKLDQNEYIHSQRLSEGAVYHEQSRKKENQPKQISNRHPQIEHRTMGFKICSMVNNVTKKFTDSRANIVNIFSQAKVNRLKKVYIEENKEKNAPIKHNKSQSSVQDSENNIVNQTTPETVTIGKHNPNKFNQLRANHFDSLQK